jgi:hypothetical protein
MVTGQYWLSSLDSTRFAPVRECAFIRRLVFRSGKECALVRLSPGVNCQEFGVATDLDVFVLANRHAGEALSPIREFPCSVFICRLLIDDVEARQVLDKADVDIVGWGEIYRARADAQNHVFRSA